MNDTTNIVLGVLILVILGSIHYGISNKKSQAVVPVQEVIVKEPEKKVQLFRFGIECPDKSRVEYINAYRLPKHLVCQPDPQ